MKRFILILSLLLLMMSAGCGKSWSGFNGDTEEYSYYYSDGKARAWEEDVLIFAGDLLKEHPYFVDGPTKIISGQDYWNENLYREDLRQQFLDDINALIPKISLMDDSEIIWEMQKAVSKLKDGHAYVFMIAGEVFPIELELFYRKDGVDLHVVKTTEDNEHLLYAKLVSINGVTVEEMIDRITPVIPHENMYAVYDVIDCSGMNYTLRQKNILTLLEVMDKKDASAVFVFEVDGKQIEAELGALSAEKYEGMKKVGRDALETYTVPYQYRGEKYYWYEMNEELNMMYVRIDWFTQDAQSLFVMAENVRKEIQKFSDVKVIVDLRGNPGGYKLDGYDRLIQVLNLDEVGSVYVLTDDGSASQSLLMASSIKMNVAKSKIAGVPIGQATTMFGVWHRVLPNTKTHYNVSDAMYRVYKDKTEEVLIPDILIYPTIEDYRQGIDTILEAVISFE